MTDVEVRSGLDAISALESLGAATATSLDLPPDMSYERYEALGVALATARERITWWIADWIIYGEKVYGEMYAQAVELTGLRAETLMNYASVARRVPRERRVPGLKFGHHVEVASLEAAEQTKWLEEAETKEWKRDELRERLRPVKNLTPALGPGVDLEDAARDLVRSAKRAGDDYVVRRASFVQLCAALGEEA